MRIVDSTHVAKSAAENAATKYIKNNIIGHLIIISLYDKFDPSQSPSMALPALTCVRRVEDRCSGQNVSACEDM